MIVTVEVMYDDLSIVKKPITKLDNLVKTGILIILFKKDSTNIFSLMLKDRYYVKFENNKLSYIQIDDDEGALREHDIITGTQLTKRDDRDRGWIPVNYVEFVGKQVSLDVWKEALTIFENEMR